MFEYHTYFDKMILIGHTLSMIKSQSNLKDLNNTLTTTKPYMNPLIFHQISNPSLYFPSDLYNPLTYFTALTDDDITDYIEGVGSNQALFMVSHLIKFSNEREEKITGLEEIAERIEGHYMYF